MQPVFLIQKLKKTKILYNFKQYNNEQVIVRYRLKQAKSKQILYTEESVTVPLVSNTVNCDYKLFQKV